MIKVATVLSLVASVSPGKGQDFFELPPIKYSETASQDEMAKLAARIEAGDWVVPPSDGKSFLRAVLEKLNVPVESQVLVFSKTSLQNSLINQRNPRSVYFSMDAYVGWVPGGKVEVIIEDEKLGPVFYVLEPPFGDQPPQGHEGDGQLSSMSRDFQDLRSARNAHSFGGARPEQSSNFERWNDFGD